MCTKNHQKLRLFSFVLLLFQYIRSQRVFGIVANFMPYGKCDVFVSIRFAAHRISCLSVIDVRVCVLSSKKFVRIFFSVVCEWRLPLRWNQSQSDTHIHASPCLLKHANCHSRYIHVSSLYNRSYDDQIQAISSSRFQFDVKFWYFWIYLLNLYTDTRVVVLRHKRRRYKWERNIESCCNSVILFRSFSSSSFTFWF